MVTGEVCPRCNSPHVLFGCFSTLPLIVEGMCVDCDFEWDATPRAKEVKE